MFSIYKKPLLKDPWQLISDSSACKLCLPAHCTC